MSSNKAEYREIKNGYIPKEWKEKKIEETNLKIIDGDRGKNYPKKSELLNYGYCVFLNNKNLLDDKISLGKSDYISKKRDSVLKKGKAKINDIILTTRGSVGNVGLLHEKLGINFLRINSGMIIIRNNDKFIYTKFLYQILKSPFLKRQYEYMSTGSVQRQLPIRDIRKLKLLIPPLIEQEQIASILSSLDDKIELNNQINKNLEEITQAIFKHWFVDFEFPNENGEPYKSSGGEMVDSEIGPIPKGWRVGKIGDYVEVKSGFAFKNKWWKKYGIPVIKIKNLKNKTIDFSNISYISKDKVNNNILKFFVSSGDILIAMTGATVGKIALVPKRSGRVLVNQRVGRFFLGEKPLEKVGFIYSVLSKIEVFNEIVSTAHGSAQPNISPTQIKNIKIIMPFKKYIDKYNKIVKPAFHKITKNINQNEYLSNLRDVLLPKLMSGEIRVPVNDKKGDK